MSKFISYLSPDANLTLEGKRFFNSLDEKLKISLYKHMFFLRVFDRRCIMLQRQGRIGTYASFEGQEACQVGSALAVNEGDFVFPTYRDHGASIILGLPLTSVLLYWMGRIEGYEAAKNLRVLPPCVPIATQIPHAVGAAWGFKLRGEKGVSLVYFGDGATSEGDFHEGCNFAGVFKVPVILFCQNNGYAISVPFSRQSASSTVAIKSKSYGFDGIRVDGNDILAVFDVVTKAVKIAREYSKPILIEAVTYRKGNHTTADDASRYRLDLELTTWENKDPLKRYSLLLQRYGLWSEKEEEAYLQECMKKIDAALKKVEELPNAPCSKQFEHVFSKKPFSLLQQQEECCNSLGE